MPEVFYLKHMEERHLGLAPKCLVVKKKKKRSIQKCFKKSVRGRNRCEEMKTRCHGVPRHPFKAMAESKSSSPWQLIDTSNWTVHTLSVVPVTRFVGRSQPATGAKGHRSRPADLPKYDQLTQIIGVRESWQLQYDARGAQLFVTCEASVRP